MLATQITTHVKDGLALLLQQYQGRPLITGFYTALLQQIQDVENGIYPIATGSQLWDGVTTPAVGQTLDNIGTLVGIARNGLDDQQYTLIIFGKIAENFSNATRASVLAVIGFLFQAELTLIQPVYPAALCVEVLNPAIPESLYNLAVNLVENAMGAGIKLIIASSPVTGVFRFAGPGVSGAVNGFGEGVFVGELSQ